MDRPSWRNIALLLAYLAVFALLQLSAKAQERWNVELVGQIGGPYQTVFVEGDYAYTGEGLNLLILDIGNPANPWPVGKALLPHTVKDVYISGSYAYVAAARAGLRIVDVSNPSVPYEVGHCNIPGSAYSVHVVGNYAYIADYADYDSGLRIINVSDPSAPYEVGYCKTPGSAHGLYVSGDYAYLVNGGKGLRIINVSNPSSPYEIGYYYTPVYDRYTQDVYVSGNYAYLVDSDAGLYIVDVSNPSAPFKVGYWQTRALQSVYSVYVSGNYAYLANELEGLQIINVSHPSAPYKAGDYDTPGSAHGVFTSGGYAYVADNYGGLRIINVSDPASPYENGYHGTLYAGDVYISGDYAYVLCQGLCIINVSDPSAPYETGYYGTPGDASGVYVWGDYAYVANGWDGFRIFDVGNPSSPYEAGYCYTPSYAFDVQVLEDYAYVGDGEALRIINVNNPSAPFEVGYCDTPGPAIDVCVSGNYAYVADCYEGLRIINVDDVNAPYEVGYYKKHYTWEVHVVGNYAYVADGDLGIVNVSDPTAPFEAGYYDMQGDGKGVYVSGNHAYVTDGHGGLRIIDVSNPSDPYETGYYDTPSFSYDVYASEDYAYVTDSSAALLILRFMDELDFHFANDTEDWTTGSATLFSAPDFSWEPGHLKMISLTNTNTYGYWQHGHEGILYAKDYLYRADFNVSTTITDQALVPQIRLRANTSDLQQYNVLSIESAGNGEASPDTTGKAYSLYFMLPADDVAVTLAAELLNFNPDDAAMGEIALNSASVGRFDLDSLSSPTFVKWYYFETSQDGWTTGGAPLAFSLPEYGHRDGALELRSTTNINTFGFWTNSEDDIIIEPNCLYKGVFRVRTDVANPALVPEMRLRLNTANWQASHCLGITSAGAGAKSPASEDAAYYGLVFFLPPASSVGDGLIASFDILNFNPDDAAEASLFLDDVIIVSYPFPVAP